MREPTASACKAVYRLASIRERLKPGEGQVVLVVTREGGAKEYEIELGGGFTISPALASGFKTLEGVVDVRLN